MTSARIVAVCDNRAVRVKWWHARRSLRACITCVYNAVHRVSCHVLSPSCPRRFSFICSLALSLSRSFSRDGRLGASRGAVKLGTQMNGSKWKNKKFYRWSDTSVHFVPTTPEKHRSLRLLLLTQDKFDTFVIPHSARTIFENNCCTTQVWLLSRIVEQMLRETRVFDF